ncbi:hypothetical protein, partial [Pseudovibrio sp. POLY-S9]|uniref:hypothetical protein n=1 Tax=Pseudovibrio sp. POLY-S9 TaxID=1576596 RepID=UPI001AD92E55
SFAGLDTFTKGGFSSRSFLCRMNLIAKKNPPKRTSEELYLSTLSVGQRQPVPNQQIKLINYHKQLHEAKSCHAGAKVQPLAILIMHKCTTHNNGGFSLMP